MGLWFATKLTPPSDLGSEDYDAQWLAYRAQVAEFQRLAMAFSSVESRT